MPISKAKNKVETSVATAPSAATGRPRLPASQLGRGWVYTLKRDGKVASGLDVHQRALHLLADNLTRANQGGGIVNLLLPTSAKAKKRLLADRHKYKIEKVRIRSTGQRGLLRHTASSTEVLLNLIALCPATERWKKRHFVLWLLDELRKPSSPATRVLLRMAPDLLEAERGFRWWCGQIGEKKSR